MKRDNRFWENLFASGLPDADWSRLTASGPVLLSLKKFAAKEKRVCLSCNRDLSVALMTLEHNGMIFCDETCLEYWVDCQDSDSG